MLIESCIRLRRETLMRKILIVIDMQNDFVDGALGTSEAVAIVDAVKNKIKSYNACDVIATMDTHSVDYMDTQEGKNLPVPHCIRGSEGWEIRPDIAALLADARIYEKPTFGSVQMATDLAALSEKEDIELELIGLCTDICVISNALLLKAIMPEVKISVDASCCAGVTPEKHLAALEAMRSCQIRIIND
jgi:nicotinamidase-related amidase